MASYIGCSRNDDLQILSVDELISKANEAYSLKNYEKAIEILNIAVEKDPRSIAAHYALAGAYYKEWETQYDEARSRYLNDAMSGISGTQTIKSQKDFELIYEKYGLENDLRKHSLNEFNKVIQLDPHNWQARYMIATEFYNKKEYNAAITHLEKVIEDNPSYVNAYSIIADSFASINELEKAVSYHQTAIKLDESEIDYYRLALIYLKIGKKEKAIDILDRLKKLNSTFHDDLRNKLDNIS